MNQAEADCLAANAYIELALHATERSRYLHYATKAEVHSLRARQASGEGYVRSRIFDEIRFAKHSRSPPNPPPWPCTPSGSPRKPAPP